MIVCIRELTVPRDLWARFVEGRDLGADLARPEERLVDGRVEMVYRNLDSDVVEEMADALIGGGADLARAGGRPRAVAEQAIATGDALRAMVAREIARYRR